jgi:glycosyltransferase involved in cell wall biosynthesis
VPVSVLTHRCPREFAPVTVPTLTAAVCTRDGAPRLPECLDALCALAYPERSLDIVVVDNAPTDDSTRALLRDRYPRIRYLVEPRPGLDWARNRAILESRGEILAFTDDDVSVDAWWARSLARVFTEEPDAVVVTGLIVADEIDTEPQRLFEDYGGFARGFHRRHFRVDRAGGESAAYLHGGAGKFGAGANMAFRRSVFDSIGLFDPALDVGTATNGGGDLEMFFRVLKEGHTLVYEPAAIVRHRHRRTYGQLRTQLANNGVGFYAYLVRSAAVYPEDRLAFARLGLWWFWQWSIRRLIASLFRRTRFPRDLILAELRGSFEGLRGYRRAVRSAAELSRRFGPQAASGAGRSAS